MTYQYNHKEIYIQRLELTGDLKKLFFLKPNIAIFHVFLLQKLHLLQVPSGIFFE